MIEIIALSLSSISIVMSLVTLILLLRKGVNSSKSDTSSEIVYCSNCCQPFDARMKSCPKCGLSKKKTKNC